MKLSRLAQTVAAAVMAAGVLASGASASATAIDVPSSVSIHDTGWG